MVRPSAKPQVSSDPPTEPISYEAFLEWADEDTWAEWVDGHVIVMSPVSTRHQDIAGFFETLLRIYSEERDLGHVFSAPYQMKLDNGREPDVLFVAEEHSDRLQENYLDGPADLVVEIVSPTSGPRDRGDKFYEYEAGGVPEYWLVDPEREQLEVYQRVDERYRPVRADEDGAYHSEAVPGFWLKDDWLWQEPLPKTLDVLKTWDLV